jgi:hypothetical protein
MAKTKISEFDSTPANNTDIDGINIAEGCAPSGINNAIRELMSQLKNQQTGADSDNFTVGGNLAVTGTSAFTGATTFTGIPSGPTASVGTNTTQLATTAFVLANAPSSPIPTGTVMLFYQAAAPTGWTQVTTQNNKALRIVSGTGGGTGGSVDFTTAFASQAVTGSVGTSGATTLDISQIPSHTHSTNIYIGGVNSEVPKLDYGSTNGSVISTGSAGGGGSHTHTGGTFTGTAINLAVQYIDVIIASKN